MAIDDELAVLKAQVAKLEHHVGVLEDIQAIRTLHFKYGYYFDKWMFGEVIDLFSEDCEIYFLNGIFKGKPGARRMWGSGMGVHGPTYGVLTEHLMVQDIVDVAPDRRSAKARFRCFLMGGVHETKQEKTPIPSQFWEGGVYENIYVREDGVWKIKVFNYNLVWQAEYAKGWAHSALHLLMVAPFTTTYPENPRGPDALKSEPFQFWPDAVVVPFHYPHPVTGKVSSYGRTADSKDS